MFSSLLFFRVRPPYIFVLIAALLLEILAAWFGRESLHTISYPLFAVCAAAFLIVHIGIVLFMAALRRATEQGRPSIWFAIMVAMSLIFSPYIGPFVGLADVWLDFRRTKQIQDRFL